MIDFAKFYKMESGLLNVPSQLRKHKQGPDFVIYIHAWKLYRTCRLYLAFYDKKIIGNQIKAE